MTSQKWFDASFSSQPIWWHYMIITVPKILGRSKTAFLRIGSGSNNDRVPTRSSTTRLALRTGSIAIELR
ncbi:unnamed protein product [Rotaria sp. Silwood2]|nr:unnamed protein product [Rotaria sp. Silwood2]CAF3053814.1 unnamed protein product [Rotaria sp. Silwood2]CAF3254746.1 unnamed protein product [Rotaria sp. Silwood2]CAF3343328.1 unnamed protein product [Rotaria sp. Silwood2]CAF4088901.1 unnamed protein product [Rotaria sp. Silwood2]